MQWWQRFIGSTAPGYRKRQREAAGQAALFFFGGFTLAYLFSEFALNSDAPSPSHALGHSGPQRSAPLCRSVHLDAAPPLPSAGGALGQASATRAAVVL